MIKSICRSAISLAVAAAVVAAGCPKANPSAENRDIYFWGQFPYGEASHSPMLAPESRLTGKVKPGARFGKYEILKGIENGGMAKVYLAKDTQSGRLVAIKIICDDFAGEKRFIRRFKREARMQARLRHSSIPRVCETGVINGTHFISMQYVQGKTLLEVILEGGVSFEEALEITEKMADALDYAHEHGIIHLDIKPSNILVDNNGDVYLFDFGLAATLPKGGGFIRRGRILGTPGYLSPDAVRGFMDRRSDVYSLGVVLYKMLAGRRPFEEGELCYHTLYSEPPSPRAFNPQIPEVVEAIVLKAISKDPSERYQTAGEFADAIRRYLATEAMPFVIAHRGLHTEPPSGALSQEPENTIAAFKAAAQAGIPAIEMDVRLTKDGVPVMFHDDSLDGKTTGKGRVEDLTWDEMRSIRYKNNEHLGIPRLEDVVKEIPGATIFVIELKDSLPDPSKIIEVMERLGVMSRTVFISSELKLLKQLKAHNPDYRAGYILHDPTMQATPEAMGEFQRLADMLKAERINILSILANVITPEHVRIIHAAGLHLNAAWDKLPDSEITRLKDLGADSFALDEPVSAHRLLTNIQKAEQPVRRAISGGA